MAQATVASGGPDIFSRLPDELLLCIISLLSMKDSVRTSALSKRWHYLYASRSNIEFCLNYFSNERKIKLTDIISFLDKLFLYRDRCPINSFQIAWDDRDAFDPSRLQGWIYSMMWHGLRKISICIPANLVLPASLFTCETLVELRLCMESGPLLHVPAKVNLPSLVVLELKIGIYFPYDDAAAQRLLSNCPVLEDFSYGLKSGDCKLVVCHPTLKRLTITDLTKFGGCSILINAPSLVYLRYIGFDVDSYTLINAQNLTEADICFEPWFNEELYTRCATNLMRGISHVRKLTISGEYMIKDLVENHVQMPVFNNLTRLEFSHYFESDSRFADILYFLESLNSLETLYFKGLPSVFNLDAWYAQEESTPSCLSFRLKKIKINLFRGSGDEMEMVKYLLQSARVLEVLDVNIWIYKSSEKKLEIAKRLLMFPRASTACNVVLQDNNMLGTALLI